MGGCLESGSLMRLRNDRFGEGDIITQKSSTKLEGCSRGGWGESAGQGCECETRRFVVLPGHMHIETTDIC